MIVSGWYKDCEKILQSYFTKIFKVSDQYVNKTWSNKNFNKTNS